MGEGDDKEDFVVHHSFATKSSKFLQAALSQDSGWKEAQEKRVPLPEAKPIDFEVYLEWLYASQLTSREGDTQRERGKMLVRLYILGDFLDDAGFCNQVMDAFAPGGTKAWDWSINNEECSLAWAKTPVDSPLRIFILGLISHRMSRNKNSFQELVESTCPRELFIDLFKHLESKHGLTKLLKPSTKLSKVRDKCEFHRHDEKNPKCSEST